jgi:hypothetical protein
VVDDKLRTALELRTIRVSALTALAKPMTLEVREATQDRADELLARLEERVIRDGGDEEILAMIEQTRRDIRVADWTKRD